LDWLIRKLEPEIDSTVGFSDAQAKLVYDLTSRQQIQFVAIGGRATYLGLDPGVVNGLERATSNSGFASVAWRYLTPKLVITQRVAMVGNDFQNRGVSSQELGRGFAQGETARLDITVPFGHGWTLEAGGRYERARTNQLLRDFVVMPGGALRVRTQRDLSAKTRLKTVWGEIGRRGPAGSFNAGIRITDRSLASETAVSPWVLGERTFGRLTFKGGAGFAAQYPDPILYGIGALRVEPEHARSVDLSGEFRLTPTMKISATGFYRSEADVLRRTGEERIDPVTGDRIPDTPFPEYAASLEGTSRGLDVTFMRRGASGLTGWVAYTWAHTRHHDTATGEQFDADYDQRHTLNIVAAQRLSYRLSLNAKLRVGSNMPIIGYFGGTPDALVLTATRNQVRLPLYARFDVRVNRTFTFDRGRITLFVEVMNLLGRDNYGQNTGAVLPNRRAIGYIERLIPLVPSAGFLIEF
ncbi:MAG TPA: TonB-dependent receptor, partial [Vicinamibacterales bacterium]|nr:TonB-dependent receptor [Vicinamibacterales bacterium]